MKAVADTIAAAVSVGGGVASINVAVAVAEAENLYDTVTRAGVSGSRLDAAAGDVTVSAVSSAIIETKPEAFAIAVSAGIVSFAAAGSGALGTSVMNTTTEAYARGILNSRREPQMPESTSCWWTPACST